MIIDAHQHPDWEKHDLKKIIKNMDDYHIDVTWILSYEAPADEYDPSDIGCTPTFFGESGPVPFSRCLYYVEQKPERFVLGYAPDPRKPDSIDKLKAAIDIYDVRIYGELKLRMMYDNPDAIRLYRFCGQRGLPVLAHLDYEIDRPGLYPRPNYWFGGGIEAFERAAAACPNTIFIGHAPGFWSHISADGLADKVSYPEGPIVVKGKLIDLLQRYPNVYCDMSAYSGYNALNRDWINAREFLIEFQDRVLYGRDMFENIHQDLLNKLDLPVMVKEKILAQNALKLVPIN